MAGIKIKGLGKARGSKTVSNDDMTKLVDTSDEWIREKTGIRSRYFAENENNADIAFEAAKIAIDRARISNKDIDICIVCTFTPDDATPAVSCNVAGKLGLKEEITAFDLNGACSGFIYGCNVANGLLAAGNGKYALVVGSEKISPYMDMNDRSTCVLFGDGAGAAILEYDENADFTFLGGCVPNRNILYCEKENPAIKMAGQEVYRFAVSKVPECIGKVMDRAGITGDDVDHFVCHQANERIIDGAIRRMPKQKDKFYKNLYMYGNTSAASIPIALCEMYEEGILRIGENSLCTGFGAGLTYGSMLIEFDDENRG